MQLATGTGTKSAIGREAERDISTKESKEVFNFNNGKSESIGTLGGGGGQRGL